MAILRKTEKSVVFNILRKLLLLGIRKVGDKSIYDNDLVYWSSRGKALGNRAFSKSMLRIFRQQNNKCNLCGLKFLPGDVIEIDHIAPKASGGKDYYSNLQAVHGHCHDQKS